MFILKLSIRTKHKKHVRIVIEENVLTLAELCSAGESNVFISLPFLHLLRIQSQRVEKYSFKPRIFFVGGGEIIKLSKMWEV